MGFVLTSSTQTLYAYLTQKGRNNLLFEDSDKFKITYFSLHDDDVDYKITSNIINLDFNKLPKGFVPDVTGDDDICIRSVSEANTVSSNQSKSTSQIQWTILSIQPIKAWCANAECLDWLSH